MKIEVREIRIWEIELESIMPEPEAVIRAEAMIHAGAPTAHVKRTVRVHNGAGFGGSRRTSAALFAFLNGQLT